MARRAGSSANRYGRLRKLNVRGPRGFKPGTAAHVFGQRKKRRLGGVTYPYLSQNPRATLALEAWFTGGTDAGGGPLTFDGTLTVDYGEAGPHPGPTNALDIDATNIPLGTIPLPAPIVITGANNNSTYEIKNGTQDGNLYVFDYTVEVTDSPIDHGGASSILADSYKISATDANSDVDVTYHEVTVVDDTPFVGFQDKNVDRGASVGFLPSDDAIEFKAGADTVTESQATVQIVSVDPPNDGSIYVSDGTDSFRDGEIVYTPAAEGPAVEVDIYHRVQDGDTSWSNINIARAIVSAAAFDVTATITDTTVLDNNRIQVTWTLSGGDLADVDRQQVQYSSNGSGDDGAAPWSTPIDIFDDTTRTIIVDNLTADTEYWFEVRAADDEPVTRVSDWSTGNVNSHDTTQPNPTPSAPTTLAVASNEYYHQQITWTNPTGGTYNRILLERSPNGTDSWVSVLDTTNVNLQEFNDNSLSSNTQYFYRISVFNQYSNQSLYDTANGTTLVYPAVSDLGGTYNQSLTAPAITLTWTNPTDTRRNEYEVWRQVNGGVFAQIGTASANATFYTDSTVSLGDNYAYYLISNSVNGEGGDPDGKSNQTNTVTVEREPDVFKSFEWSVADNSGVNTTDNVTITIAALPADGGSALTQLEFTVNGGAGSTVFATAPFSATPFDVDVTIPADDTVYDMEIRAVNAVNDGGWSDTKEAFSFIAPVLSGGYNSGTDNVDLSWTDSSIAGRTYRVFRDTSTLALNHTGITYTDSSPPSGNYDYRVEVQYGGQSLTSNTINTDVADVAAAFTDPDWTLTGQ